MGASRTDLEAGRYEPLSPSLVHQDLPESLIHIRLNENGHDWMEREVPVDSDKNVKKAKMEFSSSDRNPLCQ